MHMAGYMDQMTSKYNERWQTLGEKLGQQKNFIPNGSVINCATGEARDMPLVPRKPLTPSTFTAQWAVKTEPICMLGKSVYTQMMTHCKYTQTNW